MTAPDVDQVLREALAARSYAALARALETSTFLVPLVAGPDGAAPLIATDAEGARSVPVFSGPDAAQAWGGVTRVMAVDGAELLRLVEVQGVDGVLLDPAGPSPARLPAQALHELGQGLTRDETGALALTGGMQVHAVDTPEELLTALRGAVADPQVRVWVFLRSTPAGPVLTVGVHGPDEAAAGLAARLAGQQGRPTLDVIALAQNVAESLAAVLPHAEVRDAP